MEDMIFEFFNQYGWKLTIIALSGILALGILKQIHIFDKIDKNYRKYVYAGISSALSIAAAAIYLVCTHGFAWGSFAVTALAIYALNQFAYTIYETTGLRALLRIIGTAVLRIFTRKNESVGDENSVTDETTQTNSSEQDSLDVPLD